MMDGDQGGDISGKGRRHPQIGIYAASVAAAATHLHLHLHLVRIVSCFLFDSFMERRELGIDSGLSMVINPIPDHLKI